MLLSDREGDALEGNRQAREVARRRGYDSAASEGYEKMVMTMNEELTVDIKTGKTVLHSLVKNGEYPLNIDFSTVCKKREAYMNVIEHLISNGSFEGVTLNGASIARINEILKDNGYETACLGCFVESRRLQIQEWAETFCDEWNEVVKEFKKNATPFNFRKSEGKALSDMTKEEVAAFDIELRNQKRNKKGNVTLKQGDSITKMKELLTKVPSLAHTINPSDLLTTDGLEALTSYGDLYSLLLGRYGSNTPKPAQSFNPYNGEIADLTGKYVASIFGDGIKGLDAYLSPEMKSTGEAIGYDDKLNRALYKALQASGTHLQNYGTVFATVADKDKDEALPLIKRFYNLGFNIEATQGTADFLKQHGVHTHVLSKISDDNDEIPNAIRQGHIAYVINTRDIGSTGQASDGVKIRTLATENNVTMFTSLDTVKVLLDVLEETTLTISTIDA